MNRRAARKYRNNNKIKSFKPSKIIFIKQNYFYQFRLSETSRLNLDKEYDQKKQKKHAESYPAFFQKKNELLIKFA